jgi:cytochrome c-type biogenesis protein CcsB
MSAQLFSIVTFIYGLAVFLYLFSWIFKKTSSWSVADGVMAVGAAGNLGGFVLRWIESHQMGFGRAPLSNLYESLIFFALCIAVTHLYVAFRYKVRIIGVAAAPLAFLSMAYASLPKVNDAIMPLIPALQSNWLIAHVMTCFFGYAAFAVAFGISLLFLARLKNKEGDTGILAMIPGTDVLDELTHQLVMFGFLFLTIGIITGAVWANQAWGRYWGWDPKETWSLITWLIYATLLHARLMRGWKGRRIAILSCVGFMAVMFTYFGVNLLPGLHSYQ